MKLKAPFPWFGGKSRASHLVWRAFGADVANYVEPFAGSLAVLLGRPDEPRIETVNDLDMYLANFWRAVKWSPDLVAEHADWPVNEADLHARHRWLVGRAEFRERMKHEPEFCDVRIAGWWVWGLCQWIGGGWCASSNWDEAVSRARGTHTAEEQRRPSLLASNGVHRRQIETAEVEGRPSQTRGKGVHRTNGSTDWEGRTNAGRRARGGHLGTKRERNLSTSAEWEKRPSLDRGGRGDASVLIREQLPMLSGDSGAAGRGMNASGLHDKMPKADLGRESRLTSGEAIASWMQALSVRLRRTRVCCGDWKRVLGRSVTECIGITGVMLDPPYSAEADRDPSLYAAEDLNVAHDVREWALENGNNRKLRIALCGYEGEHEMPDSWQCVSWKAVGGYAAAAGNTKNAKRERIWFSPACHRVDRAVQLELEAAS